jgi:hypothetical protein
MKTFQIQTTLQVTGFFTDSLTGQLADPSDVILYLEAPGQAAQQFTFSNNQIIRNGVGSYSYTFTPTASGVWLFKWQGIGAIVATSPDVQFDIAASQVIAG